MRRDDLDLDDETNELVLKFEELMRTVFGKTEAENVRHIQAREFFMARMIQHPPTRKLFRELNRVSGVRESAKKLRAAIEALDVARRSPSGDVLAAEVRKRNAGNMFLMAYKGMNAFQVLDCVKRYTTTLGLEWDWLESDLIRYWIWEIVGWANKRDFRPTYIYEPTQHPAPDVKFLFEPDSGETFQAMLDRFQQEAKAFIKEQTTAYKEIQGRLRKDQDVERYVDWFFRRDIKRESAQHIRTHDTDGTPLEWPFDWGQVNEQADIAKTWLGYGYDENRLRKILEEEGNQS
jgi:hypothetical protein